MLNMCKFKPTASFKELCSKFTAYLDTINNRYPFHPWNGHGISKADRHSISYKTLSLKRFCDKYAQVEQRAQNEFL